MYVDAKEIQKIAINKAIIQISSLYNMVQKESAASQTICQGSTNSLLEKLKPMPQTFNHGIPQ
uniref:Uncharacterized protein n=1 Tax=Rhizophora mucronata TaxID=61149 RepID=A0A2P2QP14_RHIMU